MTCPRPGSMWVAQPGSPEACPIPKHPLASAPLPFSSPPPSSMVPASQIHPRRWARNGEDPRKAEAQSSWELLGPWASLGSLGCQRSAGNNRGQIKCQDLAAFLVGCWVSPHPILPIFNDLLTHLYWALSASVCSSTGLRLTLPRQVGKIPQEAAGDRGSHGPF